MKTKRKRKGKKKRTLEGDPSHRKTEGEIFQTKSDPDGGEGSGERRKGRTEGGGVLPELKKTRESPLKKKMATTLQGSRGALPAPHPRGKEGNHHQSPLPAPPPPPAAAPAVRSARFSPLYSEPTSCASRRRRRRRRETGRRGGGRGGKGGGSGGRGRAREHRESRVRRRAGAEAAAGRVVEPCGGRREGRG